MSRFFAIVFAVFAAGPGFAQEADSGDAAAGEKAFGKCRSCHTIEDDAGDVILRGGRSGPNLYGVAGRVAGTVEGFRYGDALVAAGEAGLAWGAAEFTPYLIDPKGFLVEYLEDRKAKTRMGFRLKDPQDAADIWAYLLSVGPEQAGASE
ncbi:MAG: c-type cytochrome [Sulfitobacter sp.]